LKKQKLERVTVKTTTEEHDVSVVLGAAEGNEDVQIWYYIMYNNAQVQYLSQTEEGGPLHVEGACSRISSKDIVSTIKNVDFTCTEIVSTLGIPKKNSKVMTLKTPFTKEQLQEAQQAILDRCDDDSE
jgi:hypothetical protein